MFNKTAIIENGRLVLNTMKSMHHYSYKELQKLTSMESVTLCYALLQLLHDNMIIQDRDPVGVYYAVL